MPTPADSTNQLGAMPSTNTASYATRSQTLAFFVLMVFLIQQSQNKDSVAMHLKLNELLAAHRSASNHMIGIETLDEQDLKEVAAFYARLAVRAKVAEVTKEVHLFDEEGMPASASGPAGTADSSRPTTGRA